MYAGFNEAGDETASKPRPHWHKHCAEVMYPKLVPISELHWLEIEPSRTAGLCTLGHTLIVSILFDDLQGQLCSLNWPHP